MIWVGIGGFFGAITRYIIGQWINKRFLTTFPLGTLFINLTGSFLLGMLVYLYVEQLILEFIWLLFGVGFLGAYTTFSTFSVEVVQLVQNNESKKAISYVITSVVFGILLAMIGYFLFFKIFE